MKPGRRRACRVYGVNIFPEMLNPLNACCLKPVVKVRLKSLIKLSVNFPQLRSPDFIDSFQNAVT